MAKRAHRATAGLAVLAFLALLPGIGCTTSTQVGLEYVVQPDHPEIFQDEGPPLRVCVADVAVDWRVHEQGPYSLFGGGMYRWTYTDGTGRIYENSLEVSSGPFTRRDGEMWQNALRSQIAAVLQERADANGCRIELVERDQLSRMLDERDLKLADIVEGEATELRMLPVDVFIFGEISGRTVIHKEYRSSSWGRAAAMVPYVGGLVAAEASRPKLRLRRVMTFEGNLRVVDGANGRKWLTHAISEQRQEDKKSHMFRDVSELSLLPAESEISGMLESEVREFIGRMLPRSIAIQFELKSSSDEASQQGVRFAEVGQWADALEAFKAAILADAEDDRSLFGAGLACEQLGRFDDAEKYYRQAVMNSDADDADDYEHQYRTSLARATERRRRGAAEPGAGAQPGTGLVADSGMGG